MLWDRRAAASRSEWQRGYKRPRVRGFQFAAHDGRHEDRAWGLISAPLPRCPRGDHWPLLPSKPLWGSCPFQVPGCGQNLLRAHQDGARPQLGQLSLFCFRGDVLGGPVPLADYPGSQDRAVSEQLQLPPLKTRRARHSLTPSTWTQGLGRPMDPHRCPNLFADGCDLAGGLC